MNSPCVTVIGSISTLTHWRVPNLQFQRKVFKRASTICGKERIRIWRIRSTSCIFYEKYH